MIAALALVLAQAGPPAPQASNRQTVAVRWEATGKSCVATVHGVDTGDVGTDAGKAALVAALPDRGAALYLRGGTDAPYDCTIAIVDTLKHAGYWGRIDVLAAPR